MAKNSKKTSWLSKFNFGPFWTWLIPAVALFIKLITIANTPNHIWPGSDAESYLDGVNGLIKSGLFSDAEKLQYFPAGYPVFIWILSKISLSNALLLLSLTQSLIYALASWYLIKKLNTKKFVKFTPWLALLISFNPTLSLASMVVGYESLVASLLMISVGILLNIKKDLPNNWKNIILYSIVSTIASFLQPRYLATSFIILMFWIWKEFKFSNSKKYLAISVVILLISPMFLGFRNSQATDKFFVSNNLGATMNVGAGPKSSGGYSNKATGVDCPADVKTDNQKVICVLKWYVTNPLQFVRLSYNKTIYFFSPWSGPLANGTMARNPWLKINPLQQTAKTQEGFKMVYGGFGKFVSWVWFLSCFGTMVWGFIWLLRQKEELRILGQISGLIVGVSWLIALGTIGDHRFRIPVMAFIFVLQLAGLRGLSRKPLVLKGQARKR